MYNKYGPKWSIGKNAYTFLYFIEVHESVILGKVYNRHNIIRRENFKTKFVLFFLEVCDEIMNYKFLQPKPCEGKENMCSSFLVL